MHLLALRFFGPIGHVVFALLLGVVALGACAIYNEQLLVSLLKTAGAFRDWVVTYKDWPKIEIIARLVLHESSILLMFFTLMARIVLSFLVWIVQYILFGGSRSPS